MKSAFLGLLLCLALLPGIAPPASAQTPPDTNFDKLFDNLAAQAAAALDSKPDEAVALYRKALAIRPAWAEGWLYMAASLFQLRQYGEARNAFRQGLSLAPGQGTAWGFLGMCEYELGDYDRAVEHIRKAESLGLGDNLGFVSAVRRHGALVYMRAADFTRAMDQLRPLVTAGDNSPELIEILGLGLLAMPSPSADAPAERRALVNLAGRAAWAFFAQHPGDASTLFQQLAAQYPKEPGVHYAYGIYFLDRDAGAALAEFRKELDLNPSHVFARLQIAFLRLKAGEPAEALTPAREAVALQPANPLCHVALGRALLSMGQIDKAIPALEAAVKLGPDSPPPHFYLEQAYRRAGRDADARKEKAEFTRLMDAQAPLTLPSSDRAR